jgi:hypothetical protein
MCWCIPVSKMEMTDAFCSADRKPSADATTTVPGAAAALVLVCAALQVLHDAARANRAMRRIQAPKRACATLARL